MYRILEPLKVGKAVLRNRIAYIGMAKYLSSPDNFITEREIAYYSNYAKNGVAMITTGACLVSPEYPSKLPKIIGMYDDKFIPGMKALADKVHEYGGKLFFQPWHPGKINYGCTPEQTKSCADFTKEELHHIQDQFVEAIVRAYKAGADGCEWHMAHNYLPEQMAVPAFNKRTDEYGADTIENAARFSTEVLTRVRALCGEDFLLTVKINAYDMGVEGGMTPGRCAELCRALESVGADLFTVSAGGGLTDLTGMSGDGGAKEGWKIPFAAEVKKNVSVPVMATGTIRHLEIMEKALEDGACDLIGMGRGLLAEPEFVKKIAEGRQDELKCCINCMNCFIPAGESAGHCSVNPVATFEYLVKENDVAGEGKTVAVIGAGPTGIEAALKLAKRGFHVVLLEQTGHLGGSVYFASKPYKKEKLNWLLESYRMLLEKNKVEVRLNTEATPELLKELRPDRILVASGTNPIIPRSIPGIDGANVIEANQCLNHVNLIEGKNVVVIGGGLVGLEVSSTYAAMGNKTSVVEMMPADKMEINMPVTIARRHAKEVGVDVHFGTKLISIKEHSIIVEDENGNSSEMPADIVLLCMGFRPDKPFADKLANEFDNVEWIGSDDGIGNIPKAARRGYLAAEQLSV